ncbi:MAG: TetR/AcrR family transcriptional regulator [Streptosporangiaceae bacterium]
MPSGPARAISGEAVDGQPHGNADSAEWPFTKRMQEYRFPEGYRRMFLAAVAAFSERGFHGTTTRDIAARAEMSPAALYAFFSSKEDVLYKIAESALDLTAEMVSAEVSQGADYARRLESVVSSLSAWHAYHSPVARVVLYQLDALNPDHLAEIVGKKRAIGRLVRDVIADGVSAGEFTVADVAGTATAITSMCLDVSRWYRPGHSRTPEAIGELNAELALRIVGARSAPIR